MKSSATRKVLPQVQLSTLFTSAIRALGSPSCLPCRSLTKAGRAIADAKAENLEHQTLAVPPLNLASHRRNV